jgi:hypothetical protein
VEAPIIRLPSAAARWGRHYAYPYPKLRLLPALLEEEISKRRKASANDGSQQCAGYTDDRGENRYVHHLTLLDFHSRVTGVDGAGSYLVKPARHEWALAREAGIPLTGHRLNCDNLSQ